MFIKDIAETLHKAGFDAEIISNDEVLVSLNRKVTTLEVFNVLSCNIPEHNLHQWNDRVIVLGEPDEMS